MGGVKFNCVLDAPRMPDLAEVASRYEVREDGCWQWVRKIATVGYGRMYHGGVEYAAHRLVYELTVERIPEGQVLDHLCRNRACVNPDHMDVVPFFKNVRRGLRCRTAANESSDLCPNGHEWTLANTYYPPATGARTCRACVRESGQRHRARKNRQTK